MLKKGLSMANRLENFVTVLLIMGNRTDCCSIPSVIIRVMKRKWNDHAAGFRLDN